MEVSVTDMFKHLDSFTEIYQDGKEINPVPENTKVSIYCKSSDGWDEGFMSDINRVEAGINILIARKWILQTELEKLVNQ